MDADERSEEVISPYHNDEEVEEEEREEEQDLGDDDDDQQEQHEHTDEENGDGESAEPSFYILTTAQLEQWVAANNQIDVGTAGNVVWTVSSAKHGNGVRHLMHYHDLNTFWQSDGVLPHVIRIRLSQLTPVEALAVYVNSAVDQSYSPRVIQVKAGTHEGDMTEVAKADIGAGQECGWVLMELGDRSESNNKTNAEAAGGKAEKEKKDAPAKASAGSSGGNDGQHHRDNGAGSQGAPPISYRDVAAALGHAGTAAEGHAPSPTQAASPAPFPDAALAVADRWLWCTMLDICICENQFNGRDCHLRGICLTGPRYEELEKGQMGTMMTWADGVAEEAEAERDPAASVRSILSGARRTDAAVNDGNGSSRRPQQDWLLR